MPDSVLTDLFDGLRDRDVRIMTQCLSALLGSQQKGVYERMISLLGAFNKRRLRLVPHPISKHLTPLGLRLLGWLLRNENDPSVLLGALEALIENCRTAREQSFRLPLPYLESTARRCLLLLWWNNSKVVATSLGALIALCEFPSFRSGGRLYHLRQEVVSEAVALLSHEDQDVQASACAALSHMADEAHAEVIQQCIDLARSNNPKLVTASLIALERLCSFPPCQMGGPLYGLRQQAVTRARVLLDHPVEEVQATACSVLGFLGEQSDIDLLTPKTESGREKVRRSADFAVKKLRDRLGV